MQCSLNVLRWWWFEMVAFLIYQQERYILHGSSTSFPSTVLPICFNPDWKKQVRQEMKSLHLLIPFLICQDCPQGCQLIVIVFFFLIRTSIHKETALAGTTNTFLIDDKCKRYPFYTVLCQSQKLTGKFVAIYNCNSLISENYSPLLLSVWQDIGLIVYPLFTLKTSLSA